MSEKNSVIIAKSIQSYTYLCYLCVAMDYHKSANSKITIQFRMIRCSVVIAACKKILFCSSKTCSKAVWDDLGTEPLDLRRNKKNVARFSRSFKMCVFYFKTFQCLICMPILTLFSDMFHSLAYLSY